MKEELITAAFFGGLTIMNTPAQEKTPGYNTKISEKIMTPDKVETRIETLESFDGPPSAATAEKCMTTSTWHGAWKPAVQSKSVGGQAP